MTRKKQNTKVKTNDKATFKGFFNPLVTQELKDSVKALNLDTGPTLDRVEELIQDGLKLSIVSDAENTHYTFSLFDKRSDSDSQGYVLSIKHSSFSKGVGLLSVLHNEVYERKGWGAFIKGEVDLDW